MERVKLTEDNFLEVAHKAADVLRRGYAILFPTDTLYALGVDALNENAVEHFFALKQRPAEKPVPIFVRDLTMAKDLAFFDRKQEEIVQKLWPGPFTCLLYKRNKVSLRLTADTQKVGLRIPDNSFCSALLHAFGRPITGSSANISGIEPDENLDAIIEQFRAYSQVPELVIDTGPCEDAHPSTVIDLTGRQPKILRMKKTTLLKMQDIFGRLS